jgi:16S rRNA C967 or C1407 C5-methylase (RsmB/RsmF family)
MSLVNLKFEEFYSDTFKDRWPGLRESLLIKEKQVHRLNQFATPNSSTGRIGRSLISSQLTDVQRDPETSLLQSYVMDPASIIVAEALKAQPDDHTLDMCAAPGGKTLILAEHLKMGEGQLIANEISKGRRDQLIKVIQQYVDRTTRDRVRVSGKDGGLFTKSHPESFDKILLDAPCSGERHLLQNQKELSLWSKSRTEKLAQRQYALLTAALICLKPQGRLVYSTCALSPEENDHVLQKLLKKKEGFQILTTAEECLPKMQGFEVSIERTEYGHQVLPDRNGFGPLYWAVIIKD